MTIYDKRKKANEKILLLIKTITGITIGTVIFSIVATSPLTTSYFISSANAEANVRVAQFKDLIKYSFQCVSLQNGKFLATLEDETVIYPTDSKEIPKIVINPNLIRIFAGNDLKTSSPVVYFDVEGDIKNYINPVNPVYYKKGEENGINKSDIDINFNLEKFISDNNNNISNKNITGTITIRYLNSYKYEKIPVEFTRQYLLYEFGKELFGKLNLIKNNGNDLKKADENASKKIIGSYYKLNDRQSKMIDMISPELVREIEALINSHNDLIKKYDDLLVKKTNLEKELASTKSENSLLNKDKAGNAKAIESLNIQIDDPNTHIDKLKPIVTPSATDETRKQVSTDTANVTQQVQSPAQPQGSKDTSSDGSTTTN